ncbi:MAG TPA: HD domain-containing protein [Spirochaetota bacterium]|nr:HD domain-containing protein [Spirochaetota bacterium]
MDNILLKENHSYRVSKFAEQIACSIDLCDSDIKLAGLIGLLHDTGRFPQFSQYRTFRDNLSINHAVLGVSTLKKYAILNSIPSIDREIIHTAIFNHNSLHIEEGISDTALTHSRIIRDADKLDIIPIMLDYYEKRDQNPNSSLELAFEDTPGYNLEIVERILNSQNVPNSIRVNYNDLKLTQLAWLLDLNFPFSRRYALDNGFPDKIASHLPDDSTIHSVIIHVINTCKKNI